MQSKRIKKMALANRAECPIHTDQTGLNRFWGDSRGILLQCIVLLAACLKGQFYERTRYGTNRFYHF